MLVTRARPDSKPACRHAPFNVYELSGDANLPRFFKSSFFHSIIACARRRAMYFLNSASSSRRTACRQARAAIRTEASSIRSRTAAGTTWAPDACSITAVSPTSSSQSVSGGSFRFITMWPMRPPLAFDGESNLRGDLLERLTLDDALPEYRGPSRAHRRARRHWLDRIDRRVHLNLAKRHAWRSLQTLKDASRSRRALRPRSRWSTRLPNFALLNLPMSIRLLSICSCASVIPSLFSAASNAPGTESCCPS